MKLYNLTDASKMLGVNNTWLRGFAAGAKIGSARPGGKDAQRIKSYSLFTDDDIELLRQAIKERKQ